MKEGMKKIKFELGKNSYSVLIGGGLIRKSGSIITDLEIGSQGIIITNSKIYGLYGGLLTKSLAECDIKVRTLKVPDSESSKSQSALLELLAKIAKFDKGIKPFIIAFGGGVIGDLAGFVSAIYRRGVPLVQIPTTLVAQVDSSMGGKVAIDLDVAKNLVGAFHQPKVVISDTHLLKSLPEKEIKCGLSEIIKYAVISDRKLFGYLERNIGAAKHLRKDFLDRVILRSADIKARVVSKDERDTKGIRAILNFGHTLGHAIESATGYSGSYTHGEAIAIGMAAAAFMAVRMGMLGERDLKRIISLIKKADLPISARKVKVKKILNSLGHDKKFVEGSNTFILPTAIGKVKVVKAVPRRVVEEGIAYITRR